MDHSAHRCYQTGTQAGVIHGNNGWGNGGGDGSPNGKSDYDR